MAAKNTAPPVMFVEFDIGAFRFVIVVNSLCLNSDSIMRRLQKKRIPLNAFSRFVGCCLQIHVQGIGVCFCFKQLQLM
jgi:hypothetical protein